MSLEEVCKQPPSLILNGSLSWASPVSGLSPHPVLLKAAWSYTPFTGSSKIELLFFAVHSLAKGPSPGQEVCAWLPTCGSGRESGLLTPDCRDLAAKSNQTPDLLDRYIGTVCPGPLEKKKGERIVFDLWQFNRYFSHGEQFECP